MKEVTRKSMVHEGEKQNQEEDKWDQLKEWEKTLLEDSLRGLSLSEICRRESKV